MIGLTGGVLEATVPSPFEGVPEYEVYLRGPVGAIAHRFGTVDRYRHGGAHATGLVASWPAPQDAWVDGHGILEGGQVSIAIDVPKADSVARAAVEALAGAARGQTYELELVTRHRRADGTTLEITNERRVVVRRTARRPDYLALECADVDRSALEALFPAETYTVADWPGLFADHVNRPVAQAVGTVVKIPCAYLSGSGGAWKYGVAKVLGAAHSVLTVYRDGRIVSPSEYTVGTQAAAVSPYSVTTITFAKEQADQQGRLYTIEADVTGPGSRYPADEISRILAALGVTADASSIAAAAAYHASIATRGDYGYVTQRTGIAILEDLLFVARGQLYQKPDGAYALWVDAPRTAAAMFDATGDLIAVDEYAHPELRKTLTLHYRPSTSQREEYGGKLQRTTPGLSGEAVYKSPFIRDHDVADRLLCYLEVREETRASASATIYGAQLAVGDVVGLVSPVHWDGGKLFAAQQVSRPAHANALQLEEYSPDRYVYTPATLPAGATNGYLPDYSQTPPAAPTGLTVVSQGTSVDTDGKVTAYALIRATPPAVNWSRLVAQVKDTTTNEIYQAQLILAGGNYEATVSGLRPNRAHTVVAWAVNATNVDGISTAAVAFNSAEYAAAPGAPTGLTAAQGTGKVVRVACTAVTQAGFKEYIWFRKVGSGSYAEYRRGRDNYLVDEAVGYSTTYYYKARVVVNPNVESADSSEVNVAVTTNIGDNDIPLGGINGPTIGNGSINRGRSYTGTGSASGTLNGGASVGFQMDTYTFFPHITMDAGAAQVFLKALDGPLAADDTGRFAMENQGFTDQYDVRWRSFLS
ncbi:MAG: hypothetical protein K8F93_17985 [Burkholderiales bacterium]|nr:hypothetical protein [Burkholderiales bacterium]